PGHFGPPVLAAPARPASRKVRVAPPFPAAPPAGRCGCCARGAWRGSPAPASSVPRGRHDAKQFVFALGRALDPPEDPFQHPHVFSETGPDEAAVVVGLEPVHTIDGGQLSARALEALA